MGNPGAGSEVFKEESWSVMARIELRHGRILHAEASREETPAQEAGVNMRDLTYIANSK